MAGRSFPRDWSDLRWGDFAAADVAGWVAVLPLAATEQHGPHLPLGTDMLIAQAYLAAVRERLANDCRAVFLPVQSIGLSTEHLAYPGTLTLPTDVAVKTWMALGTSVARAGLRKLVMITSHGGNSAAMSLVAQDLRAHHAMLAVTTSWTRLSAADDLFDADEVEHGIHGGAVETSLMLAAYPDHVDRDAMMDARSSAREMAASHRILSAQRPAPFAWQAQDLNASGVVGDATRASAETGHALLARGAKAFCELLADMQHFDLAGLAHEPAPPRG